MTINAKLACARWNSKTSSRRGSKHDCGGTGKQRAAADAIHDYERDQREDKIGDADQHICRKGALIAAAVAVSHKNERAVIEDRVDAGHLLQCGNDDGQQEWAAQTAQPAGRWVFLRDSVLDFDQRFCAVNLAADSAKGRVCLLNSMLLDEPAGAFRNKAKTEDKSKRGKGCGAEHPSPGAGARK